MPYNSAYQRKKREKARKKKKGMEKGGTEACCPAKEVPTTPPTTTTTTTRRSSLRVRFNQEVEVLGEAEEVMVEARGSDYPPITPNPPLTTPTMEGDLDGPLLPFQTISRLMEVHPGNVPLLSPTNGNNLSFIINNR